jgi:tetratricopeptide (TPR) repeat protein
MAINAVFEANFTQFQTAVESAIVKLKGFEAGSASVERQLNRMVDNFSGRKVISEAALMAQTVERIGGVSKLTEAELQRMGSVASEAANKLRAFGQDVPKGIQDLASHAKSATGNFDLMKSTVTSLAGAFGIVFSIGAVVNFGRQVLADADALDKLSNKTGIGVEGLQRLQIAGDDAGNTIEDITGAVNKFQDKLVSGDSSAVGALRQLGLSFDDMRGKSPEDQFMLISDAIREIPDPARQVSIAIDLFGKQGATILPTLKRGFDDIRNAAVGMSADTVQALSDVDDALTKASRTAKGQAAEAFAFLFLGFGKADREAAALTKSIQALTTKAAAAAPPIGAVALADVSLAVATERAERQVNKIEAAHTKATAAAKKSAAEHATLTEKIRALEAVLPGIPESMAKMGRVFDESKIGELYQAIDRIERRTYVANFGFRGMTEELTNVGIAAGKAINPLEDMFKFDFVGPIQQFKQLDGGIHVLAASFAQLAQISGDSFGGIVKDIAIVVGAMDVGAKAGKDFREAITLGEDGKKDWGSAAAAVVGMVGAMDQATKSTSRWKATMGGATTGAQIANSIVPGAGSIGFIAGAIVGWARSAGAAERAINPLRESFVQAAGGIAALNAKAVAAGTSLTAMLNAKNAKQYEKAIKDLNTALELKALKDTVDEFVKLNGGFVTLDIKAHTAGVTLTKVLDAKTPQAYKEAIDELNGALEFQDSAMKTLDDTVSKYGFSIEELGPKFAAQKLNERAGELLQDWSVLNAAGVDHNAIIARMGPALQKYVTDSQKAGTAIPMAMKPTLQAMVDAGTLTDASGKKMKDLAGLTFSETLETKFQTVIDKIGKLVDAIERGLGPAIQNIPTPKAIDVPLNINAVWNIPAPPRFDERNFAASGGLVTASGIQQFARGGNVLPFRPRGTDTVPAMLTPGETVRTVAQEAALRSGGPAVSTARTEALLEAIDRRLARSEAEAAKRLSRAVIAGIQTAGLRR